ncbi:NAD-dependent succinate-semialdehyde dehydrogenase [Georgenia deserti]|uniref:NAD-dependent succinate-semialdehyde dehydrogenase n=1 Tax=Georgenia deserti TaxID=2093781 RepID=A0ABW4L514_9MICO
MTATRPARTSARFEAAENEAAAFEVHDPATGQVITRLADFGVEEALAALDRATAAAPGWAATPARRRSDVLQRAHQAMIDQREELAGLISLENGKALDDARAEVTYAAEYFRWYAEEGVRLRGEQFINPAGTNRVIVEHEPVGVCLLVTPWNFPAAMATRKIGPAVAAGCTAILKPAAQTPLTAIAVANILTDAGLPEGVLELVVTTRAREVVRALMDADPVRLLSFTGSTEVGRQLLSQASASVMRTTMELGGNAPFLVLDDADLDAAVEGAMLAKMRNGGQACTAANRFYVQAGVHEEFVSALTERMASVVVGPGSDPATGCGPLIDAAAVTKVQDLVDDAVSRGATCRLGGERPSGPGTFYPPTVLTDVPPGARILHEEVFGPVAPVVRFDDVDDAVAAANATHYGLVSYLYTGDLAAGLRLSGRLRAGMVGLNRGLVSDPAAPFGGVKQSGVGREGSRDGLLEYVDVKYVATGW